MRAIALTVILLLMTITLVVSFAMYVDEAPNYHNEEQVEANKGEEANYVTNGVGHNLWDMSWFVIGAACLGFLVTIIWVGQDVTYQLRVTTGYLLSFLFFAGAAIVASSILYHNGREGPYNMRSSTSTLVAMIMLIINIALVGIFGILKYIDKSKSRK